MSKRSILVLGSVNTDFVVRGPSLPRPGETVLGGAFFEAPGGKGANQAVAAARLTPESVRFIAAVGNDRLGRESLARFSGEGLDCQYVRAIEGAATGVALILVDERGENMISVASGANSELSASDIDGLPGAVFDEAKVLLVCLETPLPTVVAALKRARERDVATILNPAPACPDAADAGVMSLVDVVTPNEHELAQLTGLALNDQADYVSAAWRLRELGAGAVIVTLGPQGALVVAERETWIPAMKVSAVDTTAAGDAFNGALAVALAEGQSLADAARWASRAAAISVTRAGAQPSLPTRDEVAAFAGGK